MSTSRSKFRYTTLIHKFFLHDIFKSNVSTTLLLAVVFFVIAEIGLRTRAYIRTGQLQPESNIFREDPELGRVLQAGANIEGNNRSISINSLGFRGKEISIEKPANTIRIMVLGDSATFGMEASSDEAIWTSVLESTLNQKISNKVEVINTAVPGINIHQCVKIWDKNIYLDPDKVIIYCGINDINQHARRQYGNNQTSTDDTLNKLAQENSLFINLLRINTVRFRSQLIPAGRYDSLDYKGIDSYIDSMNEIVAKAKKEDIPIYLCTIPRSFGSEEFKEDQYKLAASVMAHNPFLNLNGLNFAYESYNQAIRENARLQNVSLIDLAEFIPKRSVYFADSTHPNDEGHSSIGKIISDFLAEKINSTDDNENLHAASSPDSDPYQMISNQ